MLSFTDLDRNLSSVPGLVVVREMPTRLGMVDRARRAGAAADGARAVRRLRDLDAGLDAAHGQRRLR